MGRAEDLFRRLIQNGEAEVEEYFNNRQSEELFLDFKRSADEGKGRKLHDHDLNNLARAISGFGNSEGGVIVWGVDCNDKDKSNTGDFPQARRYIEDPQRFASRLEGAVSGRTVPPHPGVRHHALTASTGNNEGYVATYIPKSYLAPHQTVGTSHYYIRAGSDFSPTPHGVLAGMFGQHPQPMIALTVSALYPLFKKKGTSEKVRVPIMGVSSGKASRSMAISLERESRAIDAPRYTTQDDVVSVTLALGLESHGPGLTRDLYITVEVMPPGSDSYMVADSSHLDHVNDPNWTTAKGLDNKTSFVSNSHYRLAPASSVHPVHIECSFIAPFTSDLSYTVTYGYQGSPVQITHVTVDKDNIAEHWRLLIADSSEAELFAHTALGLEQLGASYKESAR